MSAGTVIRGSALTALRSLFMTGRTMVDVSTFKSSSATRQLRDMRKGEQLIGLTRVEAKAVLAVLQQRPEDERSGQLARAILVLEIASEAE